ncbi:Uncharacterized conserved protein, DUF1501 family [Pseudoxanthomonas sp. GM95]|uniref:DUF1501 domain-containing protein n=1 Tax=Pseudoxanthomonas sp. GM95 TaxID=1881043 RepID=UPI0008BA04B5|nr:DUF1501 domain-containing protein [Pseudoxanthomonas sp. GM95]SEK90780.1 Uncharacterized conserved protein, DUF1501 family [Pseudoxanthomonas sp. GM95]
MTHFKLNRREFIKSAAAGATVVSSCGAGLLFSSNALAAANSYDTVVQVFLRGAMDGLNLVVPVSGVDRTHYEDARPNLQIKASGDYAALPLTLSNGSATGFGLHPSATGLRDLWTNGNLAIVHACGMPTTVTRSHFDAQRYIDSGSPGKYAGTGWMTRAWNSQAVSASVPLLGVASTQPSGLLGSPEAMVMASPGDFSINAGAYQWQTVRSGAPSGFQGHNQVLEKLWAGRTGLERDGASANASLALINAQPFVALPGTWPTGTFANQLWTVAQSIRFNLGLRYATLDLGGWDTHDGQGTAGSGYHYYQNKIAELSTALSAFFADLNATGNMGRVTVVVQSEFGRRVRANASGGTDHGYGNPLLVLGGAVNGRRFYGTWPGLDPVALSPTYGDVPATTDYRRVMSDILIRRMGNPNLSAVFPGYTGYAALGIVQGTDITPKLTASVVPDQASQMSPVVSAPASRTPTARTAMQDGEAPPTSRLRGRIDRTLIRRGL